MQEMGTAVEKDEQVAVTSDKQELKYRGIKAMPFVIGNETFEKLGTIGTSSNLLVYLTTVFNMDNVAATTLVNVFNGTTNFAPLLGAFLCDTYFGRYKTLGFASVASFTGMLLLTLTAAIPNLHPPDCGAKGSSSECVGPKAWQMAFLLGVFGLLVIGAGGIRPCNLAFGADQFDPNSESGRRGITSFFNWYYFTFTFAMMVSVTVIVYVQTDVSWSIGLGIPAFLMLLSCVFFFVGTKIYVRVKPEGSPMASAAQVVAAAVRKRRLRLPAANGATPSLFDHVRSSSINCKLPHTNQFRFLDKGAIVTPEDQLKADGSAANPWRLSSKQQVEEVKCLMRVVPIWLAGLIYSVVPVQQQTLVIFQALQSDRRVGRGHFQIPAASYVAFTMLALTLWIPFYDRILVPFLRGFTGKLGGITILQKIGIGMVLSVVVMLVSASMERRRRHVALTEPTLGVEERRGPISAMSALWLLPQLCLEGVSEGFTVVGLVEFYYKQFPENMRSIGAAFLFVGFAGGSYLSGFLVWTVNRVTAAGRGSGGRDWLAEDLNEGRLDYFYFMVAGLALLNLGYFLVVSNWYKYKAMGQEDATTGMATEMEETISRKLVV